VGATFFATKIDTLLSSYANETLWAELGHFNYQDSLVTYFHEFHDDPNIFVTAA